MEDDLKVYVIYGYDQTGQLVPHTTHWTFADAAIQFERARGYAGGHQYVRRCVFDPDRIVEFTASIVHFQG